jgi:hypothetical protein
LIFEYALSFVMAALSKEDVRQMPRRAVSSIILFPGGRAVLLQYLANHGFV